MKLRKISEYLNKRLQKAGLYPEINILNEKEISILIEWGDWKHEHGTLSYIMKEEGYRETNKVITEENGSDYYSAIHYFIKAV